LISTFSTAPFVYAPSPVGESLPRKAGAGMGVVERKKVLMFLLKSKSHLVQYRNESLKNDVSLHITNNPMSLCTRG
jgi:hypothetical protein